MPLSKAKDRERKRLAKIQPNSNLKESKAFQPKVVTILTNAGLKLEGNKIVGVSKQVGQKIVVQPNLPICNEANFRQFKVGDKVLVRRGTKLMPYIIPDLDAGGQAITDYW